MSESGPQRSRWHMRKMPGISLKQLGFLPIRERSVREIVRQEKRRSRCGEYRVIYEIKEEELSVYAVRARY